MKTRVEKAPIIDALAAEWRAIDHLVSGLSDADWSAESGLPGWTVGDVVAHIVGTENMLDGKEPDAGRDVAGLDHVKNPIGELNEHWLDHYRTRTRAEVMADYRAMTAKRIADLTAMGDDEWNADAVTPVGPETYGRFMRVRTYDSWVHELDLRDALGLDEPSDPVPAGFALDEMAAVMPYLVGKKAAAPKGTRVAFEFTGLVPTRVHVAVDDRAALVPALDGPADVTLRTTVADYTRLAGGRPRAAQATVYIDGDVALGSAIVDSLHYMI
ncbi:maleylpyruvate isomerase family mycothiol-dependent enzyme [Gordonia sp. HY285]|uniref:maleylpyruvate isomerase family mycothiol-dependent enzyme n=1 Tax=Gordonia liuliyuniae TaxID=2911517 RepID=UPI001F3D7BC1|nr:maleylpyruvate isomerase family mycothiol-dependent enzyme [Gordonia liuliyuniae]MCF8611333.1 maleylpyruvate isomerase family mycothiol-dependent enzyme [Gordonia liuliyuniae]